MKIVSPSYEILAQKRGLDGVFEMITSAGYTCYKTEKEITPESAKKFVERLTASGHGAMLEHGTIYLKWDLVTEDYSHERLDRYKYNKFSVLKTYEDDTYAYVTTNYRVIVENKWEDDLKYLVDREDKHERRVSVRFICDRGVSHELVRHRVFSFAMESTRYCNYSKGKFGSELTFVAPSEGMNRYAVTDAFNVTDNPVWKVFQCAEANYFYLLDLGAKPEEARKVLPTAIKTEIVMTGFLSDWKHVFDLRTDIASTGQPHPDMKKLMNPLYQEFINRGWLQA